MTDLVWMRTRDSGQYILKTGATLAETAKVFGVSPSTTRADIMVRLPKINEALAREVQAILASRRRTNDQNLT